VTSGDPPIQRLAPRDESGRLAVANAPVSYGAFEITIGVDPHVPDPLSLLDSIRDAGYMGTDLGPVGYLGDADTLATRLSDRGLGLAGGYLALPFSEPERLEDALTELGAILDLFDTLSDGAFVPKPTLADAGSPLRSHYPGRSATDHSIGLDDAGWVRFAQGLARAVGLCRGRGYEPTFHHHAATYVEARWEIECLLERSDVGLCLDTGHLLVGGGDPVSAIRNWAGRINQVHLKDAKISKLEEIVAQAAPVKEIWRRRAFCALGDGDIAIPEVLAAISEIGYSGWLVVEQDVLPDPEHPDQPASDQRRNREYLRTLGL
jgi:inosose dehydratase